MIQSTALVGATLAANPSASAFQQRQTKVIDTNVSLFRWPFRRLPLDDTATLVKKLTALGIGEAWAGSFEGVLHRDISSVNQRLADECDRFEPLVPIGSINLELPSWQHDVEECFSKLDIPGVRLHPNYHGYKLDDPRLKKLLKLAAEAKRFVQIAVAIEDVRTQHPRMKTPNVDLSVLKDVMRDNQAVKVQILNERPRAAMLAELAAFHNLYFDTARVDSTDGVPLIAKQLPGRVLFGSHAPFLIPEAALIRVDESSQLDEKTLTGIMSTNANALRGRKASTGNISRRRVAGLPSHEQLGDLRIWDSYFTPSHSHPGRNGSVRLHTDINRAMPAIRKARFEKLCYFPHVGVGTTSDAELERSLRTNPKTVLNPLERYPDLLMGMIQLNANDVRASLDAINRWIQDGPMLGVYFPGGGPGALACSHKNFHKLVDRIAQLKAVIMQHTWFNTLGKQSPGASTPAELATLAAKYPEQKFLCAHAGGEWQRGIRAVRDSENVLVETSGFDASAGFIEMAVRELGAERIVFGSHLPSRSLGTELGKILGANVTDQQRRLILGENYRRLLR